MFTTIFVEPLFNILFLFYGLLPGHDFGVAVILLTVLVRILLWPLVKRQLHSQRAMQKLAPEVARVRAESGGDRQKETQALMELYKEKGTSPFAPIIPLIIQLPIFFALYIAFRDSVHPEQIKELAYPFVENLPAVQQAIVNPASFSATLFGIIDLTKPNVFLALGAALAQFYQAKMMQPKNQPAGKGMEADMAKMMSYMIYVFPVLTFVIGLTLPSALALFWMVTSLIAALQQHLVLRQDAEEMEVAADVISSTSKKLDTHSLGSGGSKTNRPKAKGGTKKKTKKK